MTLFFPSDQIQVYRQRRIGSAHRYSISATGTVWAADIQPASPDRVENIEERFSALQVAYVDVDLDVKEGDKIRTSDGREYQVKGIQIWRGAGLLDHKELLLSSKDAGGSSNG